VSRANFFFCSGAAINDLHAPFEELAALAFGQTVGFFTNVRGKLAPFGLIRILKIPGLGLGVTLFHGAGPLFGLPCAHM
jgi:hypothetical protein